MSDQTPSAETASAIDQIERSWQQLMAALDGIPPELMIAPGAIGSWSIKDLLGHIAYWDEQAIPAGRRFLAGEAEPDLDVEAINAQESALRSRRTLDEQWAAMTNAHQALIAFIREQPSDEAQLAGLCWCLREYTYEHYDEHTADIHAWRARVGIG